MVVHSTETLQMQEQIPAVNVPVISAAWRNVHTGCKWHISLASWFFPVVFNMETEGPVMLSPRVPVCALMLAKISVLL